MKAANLIDAIKKKFRKTTDRAITVGLGVSLTTLNNWRNSGLNLTPTQVATLLYRSVAKCEREARLFSIRPIIEYYPLDSTESKHGARFLKFLIPRSRTNLRPSERSLKNAKGIYVFYDSQCKALYVGKAKKQSLWDGCRAHTIEAEIHRKFTRLAIQLLVNALHQLIRSHDKYIKQKFSYTN